MTDDTKNDPSGTAISQDRALPTVQDLEACLWRRIDEYDGGIGAVWEQIDSRLKADEEKTIDGPKRTKQNKISHAAFIRAHERMSPKAKKKKTTEKMSYGIRGNPILLMNIFNILGIQGFSDLGKSTFMKPDPFSKLVSLDSKMTDMKTRIEELSDDIEVYCKKKPRISALKLITDIATITPRLYSIITNNTDPELSNGDYQISHSPMVLSLVRKYLFGNNGEIKPNLQAELKKSYEESKRQFQFQKGQKFVDALLYDLYVCASFGDEKRQVLMMHNLLMDYKEYRLQEPLLLKYYKKLKEIDFRSSEFKNLEEYILSPLYIACFYLQIVIRHLSRIEETAIKTDEETKKKIISLENETTPIEYLRIRSSKMNNVIHHLLKLFNERNIKLSNPQHFIYQKALRSIAEIYFKIFSENKDFTSKENIHEIASKCKNIFEINNLKEFGISNCYSLTLDIVKQIEIGISDIETLIESTKRDSNA